MRCPNLLISLVLKFQNNLQFTNRDSPTSKSLNVGAALARVLLNTPTQPAYTGNPVVYPYRMYAN